MELAIRNNFIISDNVLLNKIESVRKEISEAILNAKINHAYDKDVNLSFGKIHINPYGSVSQLSFNGIDVLDMDKFIVTRALKVKEDNYIDLRNYIKDNTSAFSFYPITDGKRTYFTVLKYSEYFIKMFGNLVSDHNCFIVKYTLKYIAISIVKEDFREDYVFVIDLYSQDHLQRMLITDALRQSGLNAQLYYCFSCNRPEILVRLGRIKSDFRAYKDGASAGDFSFYKGVVTNLILRIYKEVDANGKPNVSKTRRILCDFIINGSYGSRVNFCKMNMIQKKSLDNYLSGETNYLLYENGDKLTPSRLDEVLNLPLQIEAKILKNSELLTKVDYDSIPEEYNEF